MSAAQTVVVDPVDQPPKRGRHAAYSLWRMRGYLWPYRTALAIMGGTAIAGVFVSLAIPLVTKAIIDGPITDGEIGPLIPLGILAMALGITEAGLILARRWVQAAAVLGFETNVRDDLYRHLQALPMEFHGRWQSGQLLSRVTQDLSAIRRFMGFGLLFLIINIVQLIVVTAVLLHMYWPLGLVVAVSAIPIILLSRQFESEYVVVSRRVQDQQGDVATEVEEAALGYRVIRSFGRADFSNRNFESRTGTLYDTSMEKVRLSARFWTFLEIIPNLSLVVVLLLGAIAVGEGAVTAGTLVAFIILMLSLVWPIAALGVILAMAQEAMTAADRVMELFDTPSTIVGGERTLAEPRGHLRFDHVDFGFPDTDELVLRDVNLEVLPGETVAVVGATGSGKTALTGLVPRLYDVRSGSVTVDGVDVRELTIDNLRSVVATAFEEPTLFSMSARENLTLGRPDASDDDVERAIDTAQAGFVRELPWGLDTRIGEQGMSLSGGQRQRLALARAVLAQPRILVLDDTLSALDVHTEALVEQALRRVLAQSTGIVVAHRASTVLLADKVALLQDGTITHVGGHAELLATVPAYRDLLGGEDEGELITADSQAVGSVSITAPNAANPSDKDWRGVAAEGNEDVDEKISLLLKARSRRLLADLLRPYLSTIRWLLVAVLIENAARLSVPYLVKEGIDRGIPPITAGDGHRTLLIIVAILLGAVIVQAVTRQVFLYLSGKVGQQVLLTLRRRMFGHFHKLSPAFHDSYTSGRVISRQTSDVDAINEMLENGFDGLVTAALTLVGTAVLLLTLNVELGLVSMLCFPFLYFLTSWFRRESGKAYRRTRETVAIVIVHFVETITGMRAVQAFRREPRNQEIFGQVNDDYRAANERAFRLVGVFMPGIKLIGNITIVIVLVYGAKLAFDGDVTVGVLTAFLLYLRQFFEPMQEISQFYNSFQSASAALEKLSGVLEEEPSVPEPANPVRLAYASGALSLRNVSFQYVDDRPVLPDLDLEIPAGQTVAVVGTTGAGKTTLAKLMARFYDPVDGQITLDGVDLRDLSEADLRRAVVMVTQENYLFNGSVGDNIRFGKPNASVEELVGAAKAIGAHEFIAGLPEGYDTDVANKGGRLSAGQRQLVAFARAFLADPAVLILDEATSSLDVPSERLVQQALRTILKERTAIIIAHRLSTVAIADRVLVMEHGRMVEDGSPADLIAGDGEYSALHHAWVESLA